MSSTTSIGAVSYLMVWCHQHTQQWQFWALACVVIDTDHTVHTPPPLTHSHFSASCHWEWFVKLLQVLVLLPGSFEPILQDLVTDKEAVILAVKGLSWPSHGGFLRETWLTMTKVTRKSHSTTYIRSRCEGLFKHAGCIHCSIATDDEARWGFKDISASHT